MIVLLQFMRAFPGSKVFIHPDTEGRDAWEIGCLEGILVPGMQEWLREHNVHAIYESNRLGYSLRAVFGPERPKREFLHTLRNAQAWVVDYWSDIPSTDAEFDRRALENVTHALYEAGVIDTRRLNP